MATSGNGPVSDPLVPGGALEARENVHTPGVQPEVRKSMADVQSRVVPEMSMPALADLNDLTRRKSRCTSKPCQRAKESSDKSIKRMFSLACLFPMVCYTAMASINSPCPVYAKLCSECCLSCRND